MLEVVRLHLERVLADEPHREPARPRDLVGVGAGVRVRVRVGVRVRFRVRVRVGVRLVVVRHPLCVVGVLARLVRVGVGARVRVRFLVRAA